MAPTLAARTGGQGRCALYAFASSARPRLGATGPGNGAAASGPSATVGTAFVQRHVAAFLLFFGGCQSRFQQNPFLLGVVSSGLAGSSVASPAPAITKGDSGTVAGERAGGAAAV